MKDRYAIVGVGYTQQGKVPGRSAMSFHVEACANAIRDAGIHKDEVDGLFLYRHFDPVGEDIDVSAFLVAEQLGIRPFALSQETYCTRGWLTHAIGLLEAGFCRYVVVSYGDNGKSNKRSFVNELFQGRAAGELAAFGDLSTLSKYAMAARRAMYEEGTGPHVWKEIAVGQRRWANLNPAAAMYGKPMDYEDYFAAPWVVEPFRLVDATPVTDGGRALVITTAERARDLPHPPVYVMGVGESNAAQSPSQIRCGDPESGARVAGKQAFEMAGIGPESVDACEIYDCFTYTVESTLRDYGFFRPGGSAEWFTQDRIGPGGSLPVNTSGGMLSEGYFMGLTPVAEAVMQLMGRCGERQLGVLPGTKHPEIILCSDNGGVFQSHCTMILRRG